MKATGRRVSGMIPRFVRLRRWHSPLAILFLLCWSGALFLGRSRTPPRRYDDDHLRISRSPPFPQGYDEARDGKTDDAQDVLTAGGGGGGGGSGGPGYRRPDSKASIRPEPVAELADYSIKPIVYVYPQFHSFPENDEFFGENFTDWDLVDRTVLNSHGLKTMRPGEDVGYYDLLNVTTRQRWTNMISESLIYGVAYHHYWFGKPVMHGVLMSMLNDGHPDVPFMLSWANEPWTTRRKGEDVTLIAQQYGGVEDWKRHFEWLTPYFRHVNYIRARGKVQFVVRDPGHMGPVAKRMFEAWRVWAAEDPEIGGIDIIESWASAGGDEDVKAEAGKGGPGLWTDAVNEFAVVDAKGEIDYTRWPKTPRLHRVFHRGAMVTWDDTPRHAVPGDNAGTALAFAHPRLWKAALVQLCHRIKSDPNPPGEENFLFINAFNDWANGNALEPSEDWKHQFLETFHDAVQYADSNFEWAPRLAEQDLRIARQVANREAPVDVCVVIREFRTVRPWHDPYTLAHTLESLRDMKNPRWRAIVTHVLPDVDGQSVEDAVAAAHDPRVAYVRPPEHLLQRSAGSGGHGAEVTDWALRNLAILSAGCARARYLLITNSTNMYEDDSFTPAEEDVADVIGLNFESSDSMAAFEATKAGRLFYDDRCGRFDHDPAMHCAPMKPSGGVLDLGAALISLSRWQRDSLALAEAAASSLGEAGILRRLAVHSKTPWSWALPAVPTTESCNLIRADTRTACLRSGRTWADIPDTDGFRAGCYTAADLGRAYPDHLVPITWDYPRFRLNPYCLRLSKSLSKELEDKEAAGKDGEKDGKKDGEKDGASGLGGLHKDEPGSPIEQDGKAHEQQSGDSVTKEDGKEGSGKVTFGQRHPKLDNADSSKESPKDDSKKDDLGKITFGEKLPKQDDSDVSKDHSGDSIEKDNSDKDSSGKQGKNDFQTNDLKKNGLGNAIKGDADSDTTKKNELSKDGFGQARDGMAKDGFSGKDGKDASSGDLKKDGVSRDGFRNDAFGKEGGSKDGFGHVKEDEPRAAFARDEKPKDAHGGNTFGQDGGGGRARAEEGEEKEKENNDESWRRDRR